MRRGFKEAAKQLALEVRQEMGLDAFAPLDPLGLAAEYGIPVYPLSELGGFGCSDAALSYFTDDDTATFSAAPDPGRHRTAHCRQRQPRPHSATVQPRPRDVPRRPRAPFQRRHPGARRLPRCRQGHRRRGRLARGRAPDHLHRRPRACACRGASDAEVAQRYGVSPRRAGMRMNASGARTIVSRQQRRRRA